jgi:tRNA A-37 threonylcarbamoyl transferase component Bud32
MGEQSGNEVRGLLHGRYRLLKLLGQGGMAKVFQAHDEFLGRDVAVKVFRSNAVADNDLRRQKDEINVLAGLNHHSLVTLLDAAVDKTVPREPRIFFVMELIEGTDLRERIKTGGPVSPRHVAQIALDIAEGLEFVHNRGIVHRDIKPANILMVDYDDNQAVARARLTDFGIAMRAESTHTSAENAVTGSVAYISPEQALGEPMGPPTDIYSLGLVLLECFTQATEYPGAAVPSAVARLIRRPNVAAVSSLEWREILAAMTARDPSARPDAGELVKAFRQMVSAETGRHAGPMDAPNEAGRMEAVLRYDLLDTPPDGTFDRITAVAARVFEVPFAIVSVVDTDRIWFKSRHGVDVEQLGRDPGLCASAILHDEPWIVEDARADPRALANPLVAGDFGMQFYAGVPLTTRDGFNLGTLCVMDVKPRTVTADEIATLEDLAAMVMRELDLRWETRLAAG